MKQKQYIFYICPEKKIFIYIHSKYICDTTSILWYPLDGCMYCLFTLWNVCYWSSVKDIQTFAKP